MRVIARFLDFVIVNGIIQVAVFAAIVGDELEFTGYADDVSYGKLALGAFVVLVISFVWDPWLTKVKGGTPMKLLFGMRVVRADNGDPVEWSHALTRWGVVAVWSVVPYGPVVLLVLYLVSLVFIFTKPLRQAVWDQVAKTLVVKPR